MTVFSSVLLPRLQIIRHNFAIICQAFPSRLQTWLNNSDTYFAICIASTMLKRILYILYIRRALYISTLK